MSPLGAVSPAPFAFRGFRPKKSAQPSGSPSLVVEGFSGFEPIASSYKFVRPSPSASAEGLVESTVIVLLELATGLELPAAVVATRVNDPTAFDARVRVMVADVPPEPTETLETAIAAGTNAGTNENVAPVRLTPVT